MTTKIDMSEAPKFDARVVVRGVEMALVSPMDVPDLPPGPMPRTRAEVDAITGRRPGALVRLWRWVFGEPGVDPKDLPQDGGAAHQLMLATVMVGEHHAAFLRTLTTGEVHQIVQAYMGCQLAWSERLQTWAAGIARDATPPTAKLDLDAPLPDGRTRGPRVRLTPENMVDQFTRVFGQPRNAFAEGLADDAPLKIDTTLNGQVPHDGGHAGKGTPG